MLPRGERLAPRGMLTISASPILGEEVLRPILDDFLDLHPTVSAQVLLLDRFVNLVDEGVGGAISPRARRGGEALTRQPCRRSPTKRRAASLYWVPYR